MVLPINIQRASFGGVAFLVPSDSAKLGTNTVVHNHPGGTQSTEPNGLFSDEYRLKLILHGQGLQGQYRRLRSALNSGSGLLVHPWVGSKMCDVLGPWSVIRDDKRGGVLELEVTFKEQTTASILAAVSIPAMVSTLASRAVAGLFSVSNLPRLKTSPLSSFSTEMVNQNIAKVSTAFAQNFPTAGNVLRAASVLGNVSISARSQAEMGAAFIKLYREPFESQHRNEEIFQKFKSIDTVVSAALVQARKIDDYTPDLRNRKAAIQSILSLNKAAVAVSLAEAVAAKGYHTAEAVVRDRIYLGARRNELFRA